MQIFFFFFFFFSSGGHLVHWSETKLASLVGRHI